MPLEKSWDDPETIHTVGDCVFVGTMGFPDFGHPVLRRQRATSDRNAETIDPDYIDLERGWLTYTNRLHAAFEKRLAQAFRESWATVIVLTHYPIVEGQSILDCSNRMVWPYFFNWHKRRTTRPMARQHPEKRVWCFAGHAHEYCLGSQILWPIAVRHF